MLWIFCLNNNKKLLIWYKGKIRLKFFVLGKLFKIKVDLKVSNIIVVLENVPITFQLTNSIQLLQINCFINIDLSHISSNHGLPSKIASCVGKLLNQQENPLLASPMTKSCIRDERKVQPEESSHIWKHEPCQIRY